MARGIYRYDAGTEIGSSRSSGPDPKRARAPSGSREGTEGKIKNRSEMMGAEQKKQRQKKQAILEKHEYR